MESKITFNDDETQRLLREFHAVVTNRIERHKTTKLSSDALRDTISEYSELIDKWCQQKLRDSNPIDRLTLEIYQDLLRIEYQFQHDNKWWLPQHVITEVETLNTILNG